MISQKYKIDVILELVFIILFSPFLQIINVDRLILMTKCSNHQNHHIL